MAASLRGRPDLAERLVLAHDRPASVRSYLYRFGAGLGTSLPMLSVIGRPTLVLAGFDDPIIPLVNARIMTRLLPDARLHVYNEGHLGILTSARELACIVSGFLTTG